jgi:hypothetical protein
MEGSWYRLRGSRLRVDASRLMALGFWFIGPRVYGKGLGVKGCRV